MRRGWAAVAAIGLLAGCGSSEANESAASSTAPTTTEATEATTPAPDVPQLDPAAEEAFLAELADDPLLGDYRDAELVTLASLFCDNRRHGMDPFAGSSAPGDGTLLFDVVGVPVQATDAIGIDLAARQAVCRDL